MHNRIDATLSPADIADIQQQIANIKAKLPFAQGIASAERKSKGWMMTRKAQVFGERMLSIAKNNPQYISPLVDLAAYERDILLKAELAKIQSQLASLASMIDSTYKILQAETAQQGLFMYKQLKVATDAGLAPDTFIASLSPLMARQGIRNKVTKS